MKYPEAFYQKKMPDRLLKNNKRKKKKKIVPQVGYTTEQKMKLRKKKNKG